MVQRSLIPVLSLRLLPGLLLLFLGLTTIRAEKATPTAPVRVGSVKGGHIHPALCRAANVDLLADYN